MGVKRAIRASGPPADVTRRDLTKIGGAIGLEQTLRRMVPHEVWRGGVTPAAEAGTDRGPPALEESSAFLFTLPSWPFGV